MIYNNYSKHLKTRLMQKYLLSWLKLEALRSVLEGVLAACLVVFTPWKPTPPSSLKPARQHQRQLHQEVTVSWRADCPSAVHWSCSTIPVCFRSPSVVPNRFFSNSILSKKPKNWKTDCQFSGLKFFFLPPSLPSFLCQCQVLDKLFQLLFFHSPRRKVLQLHFLGEKKRLSKGKGLAQDLTAGSECDGCTVCLTPQRWPNSSLTLSIYHLYDDAGLTDFIPPSLPLLSTFFLPSNSSSTSSFRSFLFLCSLSLSLSFFPFFSPFSLHFSLTFLLTCVYWTPYNCQTLSWALGRTRHSLFLSWA